MEFNSTLFMQAGIYLVLFFVLKKLYFEPLLALLSKREAMTTGKVDETEKLSKKTEELRQSYLKKIQDFRFQINQEKETRLQKIRSDIASRIFESQKSMNENQDRHHVALDEEVRSVMTRFPAISDGLKDEIIKVMGSPRIKAL